MRGSHKANSQVDEFELQQEMAHNLVELARVEEQELKIQQKQVESDVQKL